MIKTNKLIKGLSLFDYEFLYTAYADDTANEKSVMEVMKSFDNFSLFSSLKVNRSKCEIAGIGTKKGVKVALRDLKSINLKYDFIKILGVCYSYNKEIENEKNFMNHIKKIQNILKIWRMRDLTIEGKVTIFKSLAISKKYIWL